MAFLFAENTPFEWPVTVCVPNGGTHDEIVITGHFAMIDDEEFFEADPDITARSAGIEAEIAKLMKVFKGWGEGDLLDANKNPVPPTPENIRRFLGQRPARLGVTEAYATAITPTKGFRAKN